MLLLALLCLMQTTYAQLNLQSTSPEGAATNVAVDGNIVLTFDANVEASTVNASNIIIRGHQTGILPGTFSGGGTNTITFDPATNFYPEERITVTLTTGLTNTSAQALTADYSFSFTTGTSKSNFLQISKTHTVQTYSGSPYTAIAADMDGDGNMDMVHTSEWEKDIVILVNDGAQNFSSVNVPVTTIYKQDIQVTDLDSDGDLDFVVPYTNGSTNMLKWLKNDGAMNFTEDTVATGFQANAIQFADMDGDGDMDLVVNNYSSPNDLMWLENDGNENFTVHTVDINMAGQGRVRDMDNDGDLDIIWRTSGGTSDLNWYENDGNQNFTTHTLYAGIASLSSYLDVGDVDNDGDLDVVTASSSNILLYKNDGSQNFTQSIVYAQAGRKILFADLDGDALLDIVSEKNSTIHWFRADRAGNFHRRALFTSDGETAFDVGDIDGDGNLDLTFGHNNASGSNPLGWIEMDTMLVTSPAQFEENVPVSSSIVMTFEETIDAASVNNDNIAVRGELSGRIAGTLSGGGTNTITFDPTNDFTQGEAIEVTISENLTRSNGQTIYTQYTFEFRTAAVSYGFTPTTYVKHIISDTLGQSQSLSPADIDGDGDIDVFGQNRTDGELVWFQNDGAQNFTEILVDGTVTASQVYTTDLDDDGDIDLMAENTTNTLYWYENDGAENFTRYAFPVLPAGYDNSGVCSMKAMDMEGDGDLDVLVSALSNQAVIWYENDGNENFTMTTISLDGGNSEVLGTDVDGDGDLDVIARIKSTSELTWFDNDQEMNTATIAIDTIANGLHASAAADMDGDGDNDLIGADMNSITWYENKGDQSFDQHAILTGTFIYLSDIYVMDLDADTDMDILLSSDYNDTIYWFKNDGNQNFTMEVVLAGDRPMEMVVLDMDGDGDMDLLANSYDQNEAFWIEFACNEADLPVVNTPTTVCPGTDVTLTWTGNLNGATQWIIRTDSCSGPKIDSTTNNTINVQPTATTTYYIQGEGNCGGSGCASVTTVVYPAYSDTLSEISICEGDSALIFGNYESTAGWYTDSHTTVNGCDSMIKVNLVVNLLPVQQTISASQTALCDSGTVAINVDATETGVEYTLYETGTNNLVDGPIAGTGSSISFDPGMILTTTEYYVAAQDIATALQLDGVDDWVRKSDYTCATNNDNDVTVECWFNWDGNITEAEYLIYNGNGSANGYGLRISTSGELRGLFGAVSFLNTGYIVTPGQWTHVAMTGDIANNWTIYVNGVSVGSATINNNPPSGNFSIGGPEVPVALFGGLIDEVRVWEKALTQAEIQANMSNCLDGDETNLVAYFPFQNEFLDKTRNGHTVDSTGYNGVSPWSVSATSSCSTCNSEMLNTVLIEINASYNQSEAITAHKGETITFPDGTQIIASNPVIHTSQLQTVNGCDSIIQTTVSIIAPPNDQCGTTLNFDGNNDRVGLGTFTHTNNQFTVEFWANIASTSSVWSHIVENGAPQYNFNSAYRIEVGDIEGDFYCAVGNGSSFHSSGIQNVGWKYNEWNHYATTFDGDTVTVYINGIEKIKYGAPEINITYGDGSLIFGSRLGTERYFDGMLDEVRIWDVARSGQEIVANMSKELTGVESGLAGYWNFNERQGTTLNDLTSNGHDGTLVSMDQQTAWVSNEGTSTHVTNTVTLCEGESITVGTNTYTTTGNYTDVFTNVVGCDSIVITNLTVHSTYNDTLADVTICAGDSALIFGSYKTEAGTYVDSLSTVNGCDSITTVTLVVDQNCHLDPPTVTTTAATAIAEKTVTINGEVNANGSSTTVSFEYGSDTNYGSTVTANESPLTDTSLTAVSFNLSSLTPNYTYHYRVKAVNDNGTTYGDDQTFTTNSSSNCTFVAYSDGIGNWSDTINWNGTGIPGSNTSTVQIVSGTATVDGNYTCNSLTINAGTSVSINPGKILTVLNTLTNSAGTSGLVLNSDATGTGVLVNNTTGVQATVEQFLVKDQWHYMGNPMANQIDINDVLHSCYVAWSDESTAANSAESGWTYAVRGDQFIPGKGYAVMYKHAGMHNDTTVVFYGTLNTGNINVNTTANGEGWNFVSNPYPCAIDWSGIDDNLSVNVNKAIYLYDPSGGSYGTWNNGIGIGGQTQHIPPMQGFFVKGSGGAGTIPFTNANKVGIHVPLKSAMANPVIRLAVTSDGEHFDETVVRVNNGTSFQFERNYDAQKLLATSSPLPQLYSVLDSIEYAINTIPEITEDLVIPLEVLVKTTGDHKLVLQELKYYNYAYPISIYDAQKNYQKNLQQTDYVFTADKGETVKLFIAFTNNALSVEKLPVCNIFLTTSNHSLVINRMQNISSKVMIYSLDGQCVYNNVVKTNQLIVPVKKRGIYLVKVVTENGKVFNGKTVVRF